MDITQVWIAALLHALSAVIAGQQSSPMVVWSGRLGPDAAAASLLQDDSGLRLEGERHRLELGALRADGLGGSACFATGTAQLGIAAQDASGDSLFLVVRAPGNDGRFAVSRSALPTRPVTKPVPVAVNEAPCGFAMVLVDGSLWTWSAGGARVHANFLPAPADLAELQRGVFLSSVDRVVVGAAQNMLVALDLDTGKEQRLALSRLPLLPALALPDQHAVLYADSAGQLSVYTPFTDAVPTVIANVGASSHTGLTPVVDRGKELGVALGTDDGRIVLFDGTKLRELAHFGASTRVPLLLADVADLGVPQLVVALEDGSLGLVALNDEVAVNVRSFVALRSASRVALRIADDHSPCAVVFDTSGGSATSAPMRDVTAGALDRSGAALWPGEVIQDGSSRPSTLVMTLAGTQRTAAPEDSFEVAPAEGSSPPAMVSPSAQGTDDASAEAAAAHSADASADATATPAVKRSSSSCALHASSDIDGALCWPLILLSLAALRLGRRAGSA